MRAPAYEELPAVDRLFSEAAEAVMSGKTIDRVWVKPHHGIRVYFTDGTAVQLDSAQESPSMFAHEIRESF